VGRRSRIVLPPALAIVIARAQLRCVRTLFVLQDLAPSIPIVSIPGILIATIMSARQLNPVLPMPVARLRLLIARMLSARQLNPVLPTPIARVLFPIVSMALVQPQNLAPLILIALRATNPSAYQESAMRHIQQVYLVALPLPVPVVSIRWQP